LPGGAAPDARREARFPPPDCFRFPRGDDKPVDEPDDDDDEPDDAPESAADDADDDAADDDAREP
jgi:hypothetical protein